MATYRTGPNEFVWGKIKGLQYRVLLPEAFDRFNAEILGLGDLTKPSKSVDAIAAVFDLSGFTNFCKQIEPHLSVPAFLNDFLNWMMTRLKYEMKKGNHKKGVALWNPLPFLIKFLGDGLLVLWDSSEMGDVERRNVIISAGEICSTYKKEFLPSVRRKYVDPPSALRCGLARGTVYSIGDEKDYVGSCINMAARLEKLPGITFAFNCRGFDIDTPFFVKKLVVKDIAIRGIGDHELIAILKSQFESMRANDRSLFRPV